MTQAQLAKALNSSQSRIAKMESGDLSVSLESFVSFSFHFGTIRLEPGKSF